MKQRQSEGATGQEQILPWSGQEEPAWPTPRLQPMGQTEGVCLASTTRRR